MAVMAVFHHKLRIPHQLPQHIQPLCRPWPQHPPRLLIPRMTDQRINCRKRRLQPRTLFRHRLILTYEADAEGVDADAIVRRVLDAVSVP